MEQPAATQKWLIAIAVMLGTTIEVLDTSIGFAPPEMSEPVASSADRGLRQKRRSQPLCCREDLLYPSP